MKKGISPIVASVILIATTMAIAGILSFWAGNFVEKQVSQTENSTADISCLSAKFELFTKCQYKTQQKEISFIVESKVAQDIKLDSLYVFYPDNNLKQFKVSKVLPGNQLLLINQSGIDPGFVSFQLRSGCPNLYKEFNCTEV